MKIKKCFVFFVFITFIGCSTEKVLMEYASLSNLKLTVFQNKKDNGILTFLFKNGSNEPVEYSNNLYTLGNMLYVYTPSGEKLRHFNSSGEKKIIQPQQISSIEFQPFDLHLLRHLRATETGWYRCIWRIEHLDVQTEFLYYFAPTVTRKKYKLDD